MCCFGFRIVSEHNFYLFLSIYKDSFLFALLLLIYGTDHGVYIVLITALSIEPYERAKLP